MNKNVTIFDLEDFSKYSELTKELNDKQSELARQEELRKKQDELYLKACRDIFDYVQEVANSLNDVATSFSIEKDLLHLHDDWTIGFHQRAWMSKSSVSKEYDWWFCTGYSSCDIASYYDFINYEIPDEKLLSRTARKNMEALIRNWKEVKTIFNSSLEDVLLKKLEDVRNKISKTSASIKYLEDFTI